MPIVPHESSRSLSAIFGAWHSRILVIENPPIRPEKWKRTQTRDFEHSPANVSENSVETGFISANTLYSSFRT
jgi:hypothetical protein